MWLSNFVEFLLVAEVNVTGSNTGHVISWGRISSAIYIGPFLVYLSSQHNILALPSYFLVGSSMLMSLLIYSGSTSQTFFLLQSLHFSFVMSII